LASGTINTVPKEGLEPSHPKAQEPKSCVSTSSTTPAHLMLLSAGQLASDAAGRSSRLKLSFDFAVAFRLFHQQLLQVPSAGVSSTLRGILTL
jgi:hypothetical protein